jgi:integrase
MRQAQTLTDAQLRRVLHYCRSRRHPLRDETIILTSFYAGLRAIEIAALKYADVYDEQGSVRDQFTLRATQSKGGRTRTVYIGSKLKRALKEYQASIVRHREICHSSPVKKAATSQQTPCASCSSISTKPVVSEMPPVTQGGAPTSPSLPTKVLE